MNKLLNEIDSLASLMDLISTNNFQMSPIANYASRTFHDLPGIDSSLKTLKGIKALLEVGDYLDCYLLIRRIRDCIMFDSFLTYDVKHNHCVIDENIPLDLKTEEGQRRLMAWINKYLQRSAEYDAQNKQKQDINDWRSGSIKGREWIGYGSFLKKFKEDALFNDLYENYLKKDLGYFREVTDGFTHALSISYLKPRRNVQEEIERLTRLIEILEEMVLSNFMLISSSLFAAEDYIDMLDAGIEPEEGSQYELSPCVSFVLASIRKKNPDLYAFLKERNSDAMRFDD